MKVSAKFFVFLKIIRVLKIISENPNELVIFLSVVITKLLTMFQNHYNKDFGFTNKPYLLSLISTYKVATR